MVVTNKKQCDSKFYDMALDLVKLPLEDSPWLVLYAHALTFLPSPTSNPRIVDLGCGTGRFAKLLHTCRYQEYLGIDFSPVRIEMAREYVPDFRFEVGNFFDSKFSTIFSEFNEFIILEVLEHINNDLHLISLIPKGSHLVASVPSFSGDGSGHVRCFKYISQLRGRYSKLINIAAIKDIPIESNRLGIKRFFLFRGVRK